MGLELLDEGHAKDASSGDTTFLALHPLGKVC